MNTGNDAPIDLPSADVRVNDYDVIPYSIGAFPQTQPDRLATIATLFGVNPPSPERCRILELGCAAGGNLIPMALASPESEFVGIDLSSRQIAQGVETAKQLNLSNLDLRQMDILDFPLEFGPFDYILVHGVFSWVPPKVQQKILDICNRNLTPNGVAYISYNTYPGWHARGAIREMLWYHTGKITDPAERIEKSRSLLMFLLMSVPDRKSGYGALLLEEMALLLRVPDNYLFHEHLEEHNQPFYFHEFIQRAAEHGLQYLAEAQISAMMANRFGPDTERSLRKISTDLLHTEQYLDFLSNRMFRQTLVCHANLALNHTVHTDRIKDFHLASSAKNISSNPAFFSGQLEEFSGPGTSTLKTDDPLMKAAMAYLAKIYPASIPFGDLHHQARAILQTSPDYPSQKKASLQLDADPLAGRMLNCYTSGLAELSLTPPKFTVQVSSRPTAGPYVRICAQRGDKITNLRLEGAVIGELPRMILQHLDGKHDRAKLVDLAMAWLEERANPRPLDEVRKYIDQMLASFAESAMLIG